jgi:SAM-dependent methyltransferase
MTTQLPVASRTETYVIKGGRSGRDRLRVLSSVLAVSTETLLDAAGIAGDARCLDLGCGGGDVSVRLARRAGHVIGIDRDAAIIDIARAEAVASGIANVDYMVGDVDALPDDLGPFDVVYARFLLCHLPDPEAALRNAIGLCRPGGTVIVEDADISGTLCWPPSSAFERSIVVYSTVGRSQGGYPYFGRRLPTMMHVAGIRDGHVSIAQPGALRGESKRIQLLTLVNITDTAVALGVATPEELEQLAADMAELTDRDDTYITTARVFQTWGRRP